MTRMRRGRFASFGVLALVAATVSLSPELAAGEAGHVAETTQGTPPSDTAPRTPWGDPDLQGVWTNATSTPMERPDERAQAARRSVRPSDQHDPSVSSVGFYSSFWSQRGASELGIGARDGQDRSSRTSLVVDPPDGKLPPWTPAAQRYAAELEALRRPEQPASWVELNPYDRCITRGLPGGMIPGFYNHNYQILQTPDYVVILIEMIHDARIIPLDRRSHLGPRLRQWMGNSRGRWEGDTLVVETTDFHDRIREFTGYGQRLPNGEPLITTYHAVLGTPTLRLVEHFTRADENTIDYRFTVIDPATFTQPWTAAAPMVKIEGPIFEYACHEGNYALPNILRGARARDQAGAPGR